MKSKDNLGTFIIFLIGIFSSMYILNIRGIFFANIFILLYLINIVIFHKIIGLTIVKELLLLLILACITFVLSKFSDIPDAWKKVSSTQFFWFLILIICVFVMLNKLSNKQIDIYIIGMKIACIIQIIWSFTQYVLYTIYNFDLNNQVFNVILGMKENASFYQNGVLCISGLCWHPANLIPIIIISYCLFHNFFIRFILLIIAVMSRNSTCMMTICLCLIFDLILIKNIKEYLHIKRDYIIKGIGVIILLSIIIVLNNDILGAVFERLSILYNRMFAVASSRSTDSSTMAHANYYLNIGKVIEKGTISNLLFGYGYECSGYPFTVLFHQYEKIIWVTESDPINLLIGRGIIWSILFYKWLICLALKGRKISKYYFICISVLLISGILYNVQFYWVMIFEAILYIAAKRNLDVWNHSNIFKKVIFYNRSENFKNNQVVTLVK